MTNGVKRGLLLWVCSTNGKHDSLEKRGQMNIVTTPTRENQVKEDPLVNAQKSNDDREAVLLQRGGNGNKVNEDDDNSYKNERTMTI